MDRTIFRKSQFLSRQAGRAALLALFAVAAPAFSHVANAQSISTEAAKAMAAKNWETARAMTVKSGDPAVAKLYEWMLYQSDADGLPFENIARFIRENPEWPDPRDAQASAERNMPDNYPAQAVIQWFSDYPPVSARGLDLYARALQASGQSGKLKNVFDAVWPKLRARPAEEAALYERYRGVISADAQRRRLDGLLFAGRDQEAKVLVKSMDIGTAALVESRIALRAGSRSAPAVLALVPSNLRNDPGLLFERLSYRRRANDDTGAMEMLRNPPPVASITNPGDWWKERNILARRMIEKRDYATAYSIASRHEQMEGQDYADAEWLSGWLALDFLNRPSDGYRHFTNMYPRVKSAISRARAAYWAGMAAEAMGNATEAARWLKLAAGFPKVYYGQLAARHLKNFKAPMPVPAIASANDRARIQNSNLGRAIRITHDAGLRYARNQLITALADTLKTGGEYKALAQMLNDMGLRAEALKVAKKASGDNFFLKEEAFPTLPGLFNGLDVDVALVHALIRQESQFDAQIRSPAGALGLMQVMPGTAAEVARKRGWQHEVGLMTSQPRHNVRIGSAYLDGLLVRYDGAYPLALAGYNAGPGRVNQWLAQFGDPRKGDLDWIDWIELIPIYETRNYVQRVMENYIVYKDHMGL